MSPRFHRLLVLIPWSLLIFLVAGYVMVWDKLPARLAIHFDLSGAPNGWMGRTGFLLCMVLFLVLELSIFTLILANGYRELAPSYLLIAFYSCVAGEAALFWQILRLNAYGARIQWLEIVVAALAAAIIPSIAISYSRSMAGSRRTSVGQKEDN